MATTLCEESSNCVYKSRGAPAREISDLRVPPGLCFKTRVVDQTLTWESFFILMEIKLIFTRKVVHLASFLKGRVFGTQKWPIILDLLIITFFVTKNPN